MKLNKIVLLFKKIKIIIGSIIVIFMDLNQNAKFVKMATISIANLNVFILLFKYKIVKVIHKILLVKLAKKIMKF